MEEGPEIVNLPGGSSVTNARDTARQLQGGGEAINITIPLTIDGRQIAQATAQYNSRELYNISQQQRRGGRV